MNDKDLFVELSKLIASDIKGFENRWKLRKIHNIIVALVLWLFNSKYLTDYVTTWYPCVDWPEDPSTLGHHPENWKILAHEYVHLSDRRRMGLWFNFVYMFPQILAVLSLLSIFAVVNKWFLFNLLWLIALAPWPARGRVRLELRGYTMGLAISFWRSGVIEDEAVTNLTKYFTGWPYYRMSWGSRSVVLLLQQQAEQIRSGAILLGPQNEPFRKVRALLSK